MGKRRIVRFILLWAIPMVLVQSCGSTKMAGYDDHAYQKTIELKIRASNLMENATETYSIHSNAAEELLADIEAMKHYEQNRANNEITYQMWQLLVDEDRFLLAGFLKNWKEKKQLSSTFVQVAKSQIMEAFDLLIQFEGKKDVKARSNLENFVLRNQ